MNVFKKRSSSPALYQRSLSEQDGESVKARASLKDYHWCHQAKSKRMYERAGSDLGKLLGTYRWHTHPRLHWKVNKKADVPKTEPPLRMHNLIADDSQNDLEEKMVMTSSRPSRVPFYRSISEPTPHWRDRITKSLPQPEGSEQENYFIRSFFSTLSGSFSKVVTRKGEQSAAMSNEEMEKDQKNLTAGIIDLYLVCLTTF